MQDIVSSESFITLFADVHLHLAQPGISCDFDHQLVDRSEVAMASVQEKAGGPPVYVLNAIDTEVSLLEFTSMNTVTGVGFIK